MEVYRLRVPTALMNAVRKQAEKEERTLQDMIRRLLDRATNGKRK